MLVSVRVLGLLSCQLVLYYILTKLVVLRLLVVVVCDCLVSISVLDIVSVCQVHEVSTLANAAVLSTII